MVVLFTATSCERDEFGGEVKLSSNKISYNVGWSDGSATTKATHTDGLLTASCGTGEFLATFGEDSLFLYASKSAPMESIANFNVSAFTNDGNLYIEKDIISVNGAGNASSDRFWPQSEPLNFFAWTGTTSNKSWESNLEFSIVSGSGTVSCVGDFDYTLPTPSEDMNDAQMQPDIVFAIAKGQTRTSNTTNPGTVDMEFHHALAAIHFKVGQMPKNLTIKSISMQGVYSGAKCSFTTNPTSEKPLDLEFSWSDYGTTANYTQSFDLEISDDRTSLGTMDEINGAARKEAVFMMVPQTVPSNASMEIVFETGGNEYTLSKKFSEITDGHKWDADKRYTYVISTPEEVDVEIRDQVDGAVKSNIEMTNTGLATSYMRAAVVGYWIIEGSGNTQSYIIDSWKETDGSFVYAPQWSNYWKLNENDGFYYYKYPVETGESPVVPVFNSYTLTANPPVADAKLQLNVMVQAVIASNVESAGWDWPENFREQ